MARKRKRGSAARNLGIVVVVMVLFGVAVFAVRFLRQPPVFISDVDPIAAAPGLQAENAYDPLMAAVQALPAAPDPVRVYLDERGVELKKDEMNPGVVAPVFNFDGSESANALGTYLEQTGSAAQLAHEALQRPKLRFPDMPGIMEDPPTVLDPLGVVLFARGSWHAANGRIEEAMQAWVDAAKFARLRAPHERYTISFYSFEKRVYLEMLVAARKQTDLTVLDRMRVLLVEAGEPYTPRSRVLEEYWEKVDIALRRPEVDGGEDFGDRVGMTLQMNQMARTAELVREQKQALLDLAQQPPQAMSDWLQGNIRFNRLNRGMYFMMQRMIDRVRLAAEVQSHYRAMLISLALERHFKEKGAYPAALAELVPAAFAEIPADPLSTVPYVYVSQGTSYQVYSTGPDNTDHGLHPQLDYLIATS